MAAAAEVEVTGARRERFEEVLTPEALGFRVEFRTLPAYERMP